jgi:hypothetical protein
VIDRGPDDGKAERDVDGAAERKQLYGNQPLIVIAGDDDVELAARSPAENGVAREWAFDINPARFRVGDCGAQNRFIFRAK